MHKVILGFQFILHNYLIMGFWHVANTKSLGYGNNIYNHPNTTTTSVMVNRGCNHKDKGCQTKDSVWKYYMEGWLVGELN